MANILVVDDEKVIRDLISLTLIMENHLVTTAENGEAALELVNSSEFDLVILDIMLPKLNGIEVLKRIKSNRLPVIFLSAKASLQDKITGLNLGAEDYITKPFEPQELVARINVLLRRNRATITNDVVLFHHIKVHKKQHIVSVHGKEVYLTSKEFELLNTFLENINIVLSREVLINKVWGYDYFGETRTVDSHVKNLREKLDLKQYLETVFKVGYILKS